MWTKKWITAAVAAATAFLLALGVTGCLVTAFDLTMTDFSQTVRFLAWGSLLWAVLFSCKGGGWLGALAACLGVWALYRQGEFWHQFWQLVYRITHIYNRAYHWGVFDLAGTPWDAGTADLPMLVLGILLAASAAWPLCRGKGASLTICAALIPLLTTIVVTDTVPQPRYLYFVLLASLLLVLPSGQRKESPFQGARLTVLLALPAAVLLGALFRAVPQEGYVDHGAQLRQDLANWVLDTAQARDDALRETVITVPGKEKQAVNLANLGSRMESEEAVFTVTAETGGVLYLRGQDYDIYDGFGWEASPYRVEDFSASGPNLGYVSIESRRPLNQLYVPYYPRGGLSHIGGRYENTRLTTAYSFLRQGVPEEGYPFLAGEAEKQYWALPEATRRQAKALLVPILEGTVTVKDKAEAIAGYLKTAARYETQTSRMPEGAEDFALWFLEAGEGYCVHFATAATVLLRSAGIPARYVSGYMAPVLPEVPATVTEEQAHAWAEYYVPEENLWRVLEATPAEGLPTLDLPPEAESTAPATEPEETTAEAPQPEAPESTAPETAPTVPETVPSEAPTVPDTSPAGSQADFAWILWILGMGLFTEGQRRLRLTLKERLLRRGSPNRRCLKYWGRTETLSRHLRREPPETLHSLAQRAKFSQHTITAEELEKFREYEASALEILKARPWYCRLIDRYLFALY